MLLIVIGARARRKLAAIKFSGGHLPAAISSQWKTAFAAKVLVKLHEISLHYKAQLELNVLRFLGPPLQWRRANWVERVSQGGRPVRSAHSVTQDYRVT